MSQTIGLDFGTHQTKICIENSDNPRQKTYEYFEFDDRQGKKNIFFPSIVQIDINGTFEYGYIKDLAAPLEPPKPMEISLPPEPVKKKYPLFVPTSRFKSIFVSQTKKNRLKANWENQCHSIDQEYENEVRSWSLIKDKEESRYESEYRIWENQIQESHKLFEKEKQLIQSRRFYYFKQASFNNGDWEHEIAPEKISVCYLAYIIFLLQNKYGENFFIQMGIPANADEKEKEQKGLDLLLAAYKLVELYRDLDEFLKEKATVLFSKIKFEHCTDENSNYYGLSVIPEAYAGLTAITTRKKIEEGKLYLLVDIGGGTTDIAFFSVMHETLLPNIYELISIPYGLNYIFNSYKQLHANLDLPTIQQLMLNNSIDIDDCLNTYLYKLLTKVQTILDEADTSYSKIAKLKHLKSSGLDEALHKSMILYCGGGSIYQTMRKPLKCFSDIRLLGRSLMDIPTLLNKDISENHFPMLATAYGLSLPLEGKIECVPVTKMFEHLMPENDDNQSSYTEEHGLIDT
jgi:hypothetical protein